jgi:hypothetical protein
LTDIFTKARKKDKKPEWMNEEGWKYLTDRWKEMNSRRAQNEIRLIELQVKVGHSIPRVVKLIMTLHLTWYVFN